MDIEVSGDIGVPGEVWVPAAPPGWGQGTVPAPSTAGLGNYTNGHRTPREVEHGRPLDAGVCF